MELIDQKFLTRHTDRKKNIVSWIVLKLINLKRIEISNTGSYAAFINTFRRIIIFVGSLTSKTQHFMPRSVAFKIPFEALKILITYWNHRYKNKEIKNEPKYFPGQFHIAAFKIVTYKSTFGILLF